MEILVTVAYFCLVWLIFYRFRLLRFNLFWKFVVFGLYAAAALTEVILLGQTTPYSRELVVERVVIKLAPQFGGLVSEVHVKPNEPITSGDRSASADPDLPLPEYSPALIASKTGSLLNLLIEQQYWRRMRSLHYCLLSKFLGIESSVEAE
jgi:hypothetical protein